MGAVLAFVPCGMQGQTVLPIPNWRRLDTPGHDAALLTQASFGWSLVLFVRALMRAFMCGALSMLQFIGLDSRHLASIYESIDAYVRKLPSRAGHARAQGLAAGLIGFAIPLIVPATIAILALSNGSSHSWKQNEGEGGNCRVDRGGVPGSHARTHKKAVPVIGKRALVPEPQVGEKNRRILILLPLGIDISQKKAGDRRAKRDSPKRLKLNSPR